MTIDVTDEPGLVERAASGEDSAFAELVRCHSDAVWRFAMGMLRDAGAAEEAAQDTFVNAHRALDGFRGDASFRSWLLSICSRVCLDRLRRRSWESVPLETLRDIHSPHDQADVRLTIDAAIDRLDPDQREAFVLVSVMGFSREEAALIARVPSSTMRSRVAKARGRLADALKDHLPRS